MPGSKLKRYKLNQLTIPTDKQVAWDFNTVKIGKIPMRIAIQLVTKQRLDIVRAINVDEGEKFSVDKIIFSGELILEKDLLKRLMPLTKGDTYSAAAVSFAEEHRETSYLSIITRDGYQVVRNLKSNDDQLFNLTTDPLAQNNIAEGHDAIIEQYTRS